MKRIDSDLLFGGVGSSVKLASLNAADLVNIFQDPAINVSFKGDMVVVQRQSDGAIIEIAMNTLTPEQQQQLQLSMNNIAPAAGEASDPTLAEIAAQLAAEKAAKAKAAAAAIEDIDNVEGSKAPAKASDGEDTSQSSAQSSEDGKAQESATDASGQASSGPATPGESNLKQTIDKIMSDNTSVQVQGQQSGRIAPMDTMGNMGGNLGNGGATQMGLDGGNSSFSMSRAIGGGVQPTTGGGSLGGGFSSGGSSSGGGGSASSGGSSSGSSSGAAVVTTPVVPPIAGLLSIVAPTTHATEGTGSIAFTVNLSEKAEENIVVSYRTVSGTAGSNDYIEATSTLIIPKGELSGVINIGMKDDTRFENSEDFQVQLISAETISGRTVKLDSTSSSATATIDDNDTAPTVSISPVTVTEGQDAVFTVTIDKVSDVAVTGHWSVAAGTAGATDLGGVLPSGTFTIPPGSLTATITIGTYDDTIAENPENFSLSLTGITGAQNTTLGVIGTLHDNDLGVNFSTTTQAVNENAGTATVQIALPQTYGQDVTITYRTVSGSAGSADYTVISTGTVTILAGQTTANISVAITDDALFEGGTGTFESFNVELVSAVDASSNPINFSTTPHVVQIIDNEVVPTLTMSPVQAAEGSSFTFTVTASHASINTITGNWSLLAGTANAADFGGTFPTGTFTIPAGSTTATISFSSLQDVNVEANETFTLVLDSVTNAQGGSVSTIGTILNDDFSVNLGASDITVGEAAGTASVTVSLTAVHSYDVVVTYRTISGTAGTGDYTDTTSSTITILAGQLSATISVPITNDTLYDGGNEIFQVEILGALDTSNNVIPMGQTTQNVIIVDNEIAPTLTMSPVSAAEGGSMVFTVTASHASDSPITGNWSLLMGTANAADFGGTLPTGTFTIPAGQTTATISFASIDDSSVEPNETFTLVLDTIVNAQSGPISTTGTIINNDFTVSLGATDITVGEAAGTATATVTLSSVYAYDVTVTYRTIAGTATAVDYTGTASSTVTILAGQTTATISVPITNDTLYDGGNETFQIELISAVDSSSNAIPLGQATQNINIVDNESVPTLTMSPVSAFEGGNMTFTVTASHASDSPITGNWAAIAGTANAADFGGTFPSGTFTIPAGQTTTTISFASVEDSSVEANETFTLVLDSLVNAQGGPISSTGTILNNDFAVAITSTPVSVNEGDGDAQVGISLNGAHTQDIVVTYRTIRVSAQSSDFTEATLSTITIPAGQTTANILVHINDDNLYDGGNEVFQVEILSAADTNGQNVVVSGAVQNVTIVDNELAPTLTMGNVAVTEGGLFTFTVTASGASDSPITGNWTVQTGAANAADFGGTLPSGTFTIAPGATTATITFSSSADSVLEGNETFGLLLDNIVGAQTTPVLATGTINNDDFGINIDTATATVTEGDGTVPVTFTISSPYAQDVTITYRTVAGTAGGADYTAVASSTVTILAGQTSATVNIAITDDSVYDQGNETFQVEIVSARDVSLNNIPVGQATQTITIVDNEAPPTLTIAPASALEGGTITFTVTASRAADGPITGNWSLAAGTADAADFGGTLPSGTFTIPAGQTTATITVTSSQDITAEANETFTLQLDTIVGAQSGTVSGVGTINNDDYEVHFSQATDNVAEQGGNHVARVDLNAIYNHDVTVTYRTVALTAGGTDYTAVGSGTVTILAGQYYANITVPITNDSVYEGNETFRIELLSAVDATTSAVIPLGTAAQVVTIVDNETVPVLSVADVAAVEGSNFVYTLTLSNPSSVAVTGNWAVIAGVATAADFGGSLPSGTFTIPAGSTTATITIGTVDDTTAEQLYENFSLSLTNVTNTTQPTVIAAGTIEDNDVQVFVTSTGQTVGEAAGTASVTFQLNRTYAQDITVNYKTVVGTANGQDFTEIAGASVVILAGQTSATVTIGITDDALYEGGAENFSVQIVSAQDVFATPMTIGTNNTHTINITDNDSPPTLTLTPAGVTEGGNAIFTVTANHISSQPITGTWAVGAGTATAPDFGGILPTGTFTLPAGQLTTTIIVATADDIAQEGTEAFTLTIDNINGAAAGPISAAGTIFDNEMAVSMSLTSSSVNENVGNATVTVTLSQVNAYDVIVGYRTVSSSADGSDFVSQPGGTITILAGQTSATITVPINDDTIYDGGNETFQVQLLSAQDTQGQSVSVGSATHTITIVDNESAPTLTMGDLVRTEGGGFAFIITASGTSDSPITGNWAVAAGTAGAADFVGGVLPSGTFTIPVGQTTATINISSYDDVIQEGSETFTVNLSGISGANTSPVSAQGIIQDNELSVAFSLGSSTIAEAAGVAPVTVVLSQALVKDVTIHYRTITNTAGGTDFTQVTDSVVIIPAGQTTATINIGINNDLIYDGAPERFDVHLISATDSSGTTIPVSIVDHQVFINDDDAAPTITMSDMVINEGGTATFTITRSGNTDEPITGQWRINAGTANAADFGGTLPSGTFTLPAGQNSINVTVNAGEDLLTEGDETFTITVDHLTDTSTTTLTSNGTMVDNELQLSLSSPTGTVAENGISYNATIQINKVYTYDIVVNYSTIVGTAGASDYTAITNQTVTILAGQTSVQVPVTITNDFLVEGSETFQIHINSATDSQSTPIYVNRDTQTVTITDDDVNLSISYQASSSTVAENAGTTSIRINLNQVHNENVTITYNTSNGTATSGADYTGTSGNTTIVISAGQSYVNIPVTLLDDGFYEGSENFRINLVSAQDQTGRPVTITGPSIHEVTINDNDAALFLQFENTGATVAETVGAQTARVVLNRAHTENITITYRTVNGTAAHGSDYTGTGAGTATVTILAGQTSVLVPYTIINDQTHEYSASENFSIELVSAVDASAHSVLLNGTTSFGVTVTESDPLPVITVNNAPSPENVDYVFTINLSNKATQNVTGTWSFQPGQATAADFNNGASMPSGSFTILAGQTVATITVPVNNDILAEGYENFNIHIDNITNANTTPVDKTGTIVDDELIVGFTSTTGVNITEGGSYTATVGMTFATLQDVVVSYQVIGISATGGSDFVATTGTVTIAAGQTTASIIAQSLQDSLNESDETFKIRITGVSTTGPVTPNISSTGQEQVITIVDDELAPTISLTVPSFVAENGGSQVLTVERSTQTAASNSVNVVFGGTGFTVVYNSVTYNPGDMLTVIFSGFLNTQNITFIPTNDAANTGDHTISVTLSDPVNARIPSPTYSFSMLDDEANSTSVYNYGSGTAPIIDGKVLGSLVGDNGRNVLSIGETVIASTIKNVVVDPKDGIDQVRMQTQAGVHIIVDNEVLAATNGRAIIEFSTGNAGVSMISGNKIHASAQGDDVITMSTLGGSVGEIASNKITMADGVFVGADGANTLTLSALNANAGSTITQNSVGNVSNNLIVGGDGDDSVTLRAAGNTAGTWTNNASFQVNSNGSVQAIATTLLKDGGYAIAYERSGSIYLQIMNQDGTVRSSEQTVGNAYYAPEITTLENGNILIVDHYNTSSRDIITRIFTATGTAVTSNVTVVSAGDTMLGKVAALADGGYLLSWYEQGGATVTVSRFNSSNVQTATDTVSQGGSELNPDVVALANGGYVMSWINNNSGTYDVFFQRYNADNSKAGGIVTVVNTSAQETAAQMKALKDGGFVIVYQDSNAQDSGYEHVRGVIYNADGTVRTASFSMVRTQNVSDTLQEIVPLSDGGFVITTNRNMFDFYQNTGVDSFMTRFDKNGVMIGNEVRLNNYIGSSELYTNIVEMRDGNLMAIYQDGNFGSMVQRTITPPGASIIQGNDFNLSDGTNTLIVDAQSGTGRTAWGNDAYDQNSGGSGSIIANNRVTTGAGVDQILFTASSGIGGNAPSGIDTAANATKQWLVDSTDYQSYSDNGVSVTNMADGGFIITWSESPASGYDIFMQRYDHNGNALGNQVLVRDDGSNGLYYPVVTGLPDGGYVVTWYNNTTNGGDIVYKIYNADNSLRLDVQSIGSSASYQDLNPEVAALADGGFIVVWQEMGTTSGSYYRIHTARFDENGAQIGDQAALFSQVGQSAYSPSVVATPDGGYIVSWRDDNAWGNWQRFDAAGKAATGVIQNQQGYANYETDITVLANNNVLMTLNYSSSAGQKMALYNSNGHFLQYVSDPNSYMYRSSTLALADGGFIVYYIDSNSYANIARYAADGTQIGTTSYEAAGNITASNGWGTMDIAAVGEDGFVVVHSNGNFPGASLYKFDDTFNVGGDASIVEYNNVSTLANDDTITLSASGGKGGQAAETTTGNYGSNWVTEAGDASVVQNNTVDAGDGNDIVVLSATGGNSDWTKIDGKAAQVLNNNITMGQGNDQVNITASGGVGNSLSNRVANNTISMGTGNDSLTSFSTHFINNNINLGDGDNSATITADYLKNNVLNSTTGADNIFFTGVREAHNNQVNLGSGNDSFTLTSSTLAMNTLSGNGATIDPWVGTDALGFTKTVALTNGNYATVWYDSNAGSNNVYAQIYSPKGAAIGGIINVAVSGNNEYRPTVTATANGAFIVAYQDASVNQGYMKKFDATGVQVGSTVTLTDLNYSTILMQEYATLTSGKIVMVQMEPNTGYGTYSSFHTVYNADLTLANSYTYVQQTYDGNNWYYPSVTATSDGGYVVATYATAQGYAYMYKYNAAGSQLWTMQTNYVYAGSTSYEYPPRTIELTNGNIVLFNMGTANAGYYGVYNSSGTYITSTSFSNGFYGDAIANADGTFTFYSTNGGNQLYKTTFNANGSQIGSQTLILTAPTTITNVEVDKLTGGNLVLQYTVGDKIYQQLLADNPTASVTGLELDLGDGTNQTTVTTNYITSAQITSGSGDDTISLRADVAMLQNTITMGEGTNTLTMTGGSIDLTTISGSTAKDSVTITGTDYVDRETIDLKAGNNDLTITSGASMNKLTYTGGADSDTLIFNVVTTVNNATINVGTGTNALTLNTTNTSTGSISTFAYTGTAGADTLNITAANFITGMTLNLGDGTNIANVTSQNNSTITSLAITGTAGNDTYTVLAANSLTTSTFTMGDGTNTATLTATAGTMNTLGLTSGTGNDTLTALSASTMNNATINMGAGNNNIDLRSSGDAMNSLSLITLGGDDTVKLRTANTINNAVLDLGGGVNNFQATLTGGSGSITTFGLTMLTGTNTVTITTGAAITSMAITGSTGVDNYTITAATALNTSTFTLGDGANIIDLKANSGTMNTLGVTAGLNNDSVTTYATSNMDNATINLGDGNNTINMRSLNATMNTAQLTTGEGNDAITMQSSTNMNNATILTAGGNDTVTMTAGGTIDTAIINLGTGTNSLTLSGTISNTTITTGSDDDTLSFTGGQVNSATINLGIGNSTTTVSGSVAAFNGVNFTSASGVDIITVSTAASSNSFSTGSGADILTLRNIGNNTISLGIQTNILDTLVLTAAGAHNMSGLGGQVSGVEIVNLTNGSANVLTVDRNSALQADNTGTQKVLYILGDNNDTVNILSGSGVVTNTGTTAVIDGVTYRIIEQLEGTKVQYLIKQGVQFQIDGGALTFDNPITNLAAQHVDTTALTAARTETEAAALTAPATSDSTSVSAIGDTSSPVHVYTYALYGGNGDYHVGGALSAQAAQVFAMYQAELHARGIEVAFVEVADNGGSIYHNNVDIAIGLGNGILGDLLADPNSVLGITVPGEGQGMSMLANAPHAPEGVDASQLAGDIFLSDAYLKLAAMDADKGGGLHAGSLAYYVLTQEVGHVLGLAEKTDAEEIANGYDPLTAHQYTTTDETAEGLNTVDDLSHMTFASTPGSAALDQLAHTLHDTFAATDHAADTAWVAPDYTTMADLISQYSHDPQSGQAADQSHTDQAYHEFVSSYDIGQNATTDLPGTGTESGHVDALLNWAQDNAPALPPPPADAPHNPIAPAPVADTGSNASFDQIAADVAQVPLPDDQNQHAHA